MELILKQSDIIDAIRKKVEADGISLKGKSFKANIIAGRKGNGISAVLTIEQSEIPGDTTTAVTMNGVSAQDAVAANKADTKSVDAVVKSAEINAATDKPVAETDEPKHVGFKDVNEALLASGGATPSPALPPVAPQVPAGVAGSTIGSEAQDDDQAVAQLQPEANAAADHKVVEAATPVPAEAVQEVKADVPATKTTSLFGS